MTPEGRKAWTIFQGAIQMKRGKRVKGKPKIEKGRPGALKTGGRCLRNKDHGSDSVQIKYSDHLAAKGRGSIAPGLIKTARENSSHPQSSKSKPAKSGIRLRLRRAAAGDGVSLPAFPW